MPKTIKAIIRSVVITGLRIHSSGKVKISS